jgi:hypothetical protein
MIKTTLTKTFQADIESAVEWLYDFSISEGKDFESIEHIFKSELMRLVSSIQSNPFLYQSYSRSNPTRRAILFHGLYLLEYQIIPSFAQSKNETEEIILTSLVPAKCGRARGDSLDLQNFSFDDIDE